MNDDRLEAEEETETFVVFRLGEEDYAFNVHSTREIVAQARIAPLPRAPVWVRGALNLRGRITPVLDLGLCFGLPPRPETPASRVIITESQCSGQEFIAGVWVDSVQGVIELPKSQVEPPPRLGKETSAEYISGIGRQEDRIFVILELQRLLSSTELAAAAQAAESASPLAQDAGLAG